MDAGSGEGCGAGKDDQEEHEPGKFVRHGLFLLLNEMRRDVRMLILSLGINFYKEPYFNGLTGALMLRERRRFFRKTRKPGRAGRSQSGYF
jgi:hypothetical protein